MPREGDKISWENNYPTAKWRTYKKLSPAKDVIPQIETNIKLKPLIKTLPKKNLYSIYGCAVQINNSGKIYDVFLDINTLEIIILNWKNKTERKFPLQEVEFKDIIYFYQKDDLTKKYIGSIKSIK